jgi:hypothetical protein
MISSPEDALLLLKKWRSESALVLAIVSPPDRAFVSRLEGKITGVDDSRLICMLESGEDFILFKLLQCKVAYGESLDLSSTFDESARNETRNWKAGVILTYECGTSIVLCTME